jgi:hypothetical protein
VFRRNALQIEVTAEGTVCVKQMADRNCPRAKTLLASQAPPRHDAGDTEQIVERGSAPRSADKLGMAEGTVHQRIDSVWIVKEFPR